MRTGPPGNADAVPCVPVPTRFVLAAAMTMAISGCVEFVGPARTADDYELKAADTAETVLSAVRTAELAVDVADRGRAFPPYVSVLLGEAEGDASGAAATFESIQPPDASGDRLRNELDDLLTEASDQLSTLRITARRADLDALADEAAGLARLADELDAFRTEHG